MQDFGTNVSQPMKTVNLRLEEVAHIRTVLTKAELEAMAIDSTMRDNITRGKVECFSLYIYIPLSLHYDQIKFYMLTY